jgi:hypothetical protein
MAVIQAAQRVACDDQHEKKIWWIFVLTTEDRFKQDRGLGDGSFYWGGTCMHCHTTFSFEGMVPADAAPTRTEEEAREITREANHILALLELAKFHPSWCDCEACEIARDDYFEDACFETSENR